MRQPDDYQIVIQSLQRNLRAVTDERDQLLSKAAGEGMIRMGFKPNEVWVVGQWNDKQWELQGVFSTHELAKAACKEEMYFVIGPVQLNLELPKETVDTEFAYYPILEDAIAKQVTNEVVGRIGGVCMEKA